MKIPIKVQQRQCDELELIVSQYVLFEKKKSFYQMKLVSSSDTDC